MTAARDAAVAEKQNLEARLEESDNQLRIALDSNKELQAFAKFAQTAIQLANQQRDTHEMAAAVWKTRSEGLEKEVQEARDRNSELLDELDHRNADLRLSGVRYADLKETSDEEIGILQHRFERKSELCWRKVRIFRLGRRSTAG